MAEVPESFDQEEERAAAAERIIHRNILWSLGAGLVPVVGLDMAAVTAIQLKMVRELARLYEVPFRADLGKTAIAALLGGAVPMASGLGAIALFQGATRSVPIVGSLIGLATVSTVASATTYAVGAVFYQHFASGGTFLSFDPKKVEAYFREKFVEAKDKGPVPTGQPAG